MDFKELLENSWKSFTEFLPALLINTIVLGVVSICTLFILAPVCTAGYMQSLLLVIRDKRKPEVGDLFSQMKLFLPLLAFSIVVGIAIFIGFLILVLPGIIAILALYFFCLYLLPLMTDKGLGVIEAAKESSRMAMEDPVVDHVAVVAIYIGITALGQVLFPITTLFTMPIATLFILYAFEEKCGVEEAQPVKDEKPVSPAPPQPEKKEEKSKPEGSATGSEPEESKD